MSDSETRVVLLIIRIQELIFLSILIYVVSYFGFRGHVTMFERRKFLSLQAGRGVAAIMVVIHHIGSFAGREPGLWRYAPVADWLSFGQYGVDYFFILSGVVILIAHWNDIGVPRQVGSFCWKRFRRIYPIYWIFLVPAVLSHLHAHTGKDFEKRDPFVILSSFLLIHIKSLGVSIVPSWTLFHEVLFYMLFISLLLSKRLGIVLYFCWFAASFLSFSQTSVSNDPANYLEMLFSPLHLLFGFGMLVGWLLHHGRAPSHLWLLLSGMGLFVAALVVDQLNQAQAPRLRILGGAGLSLAILIAAEREHLHRLKIPRMLTFLGDASYSIYLGHLIVVSAIAKRAFAIDRRFHVPLVLWMIVMFVAAVSFGTLAHLLIERPLLKWLSGPSKSVGRSVVPLQPDSPS